MVSVVQQFQGQPVKRPRPAGGRTTRQAQQVVAPTSAGCRLF